MKTFLLYKNNIFFYLPSTFHKGKKGGQGVKIKVFWGCEKANQVK